MTRFQNGSLQMLKRKNGTKVWVFRWYDTSGETRTYRKKIVGTLVEMPLRRDAERAVLSFRSNINSGVVMPETVADLVAHYKKHELVPESGKRSSTLEVYTGFLDVHVLPKWGTLKLHQLKTVAVEQWLRSLVMAPGTKAKIRNIMSAMFAHGKRYDIVAANPIQGVRCSSKRVREPDVLAPEEFVALLNELEERERAMVLIAGTTGLRRSEFIALTWRDIDFDAHQITVTKSCVRAKMGETKTTGSSKPVPLNPVVAQALQGWWAATPYKEVADFLFPSLRKKGKIPLWPDMVLQKKIRPAAKRAKITKRVGWHTFRHSLATYLRFLGVDVKTAQELLRHANSRITLDIYTQAVSSEKIAANNKVVDMLTPRPKLLQHPSAPSEDVRIAI